MAVIWAGSGCRPHGHAVPPRTGSEDFVGILVRGRCRSEPICLSPVYRSVSPVSPTFWHADGTGGSKLRNERICLRARQRSTKINGH